MSAMSFAEDSPETQHGMTKLAIDADGDVYLELLNLELRVSSKALSMASQVFNAMFNSGFQEGLNLANNETCRIPLPDDDAAAMTALCILIHHQEPTTFESEMDSRRLRSLSILADKYACKGAVRLWADVWIGRLSSEYEVSREDEKILVDALLVSYILDLSAQFTAITKRMVYRISRNHIHYRLCERGWYVDDVAQEMLPQGLLATIFYIERFIKRQLMMNLERLTRFRLELDTLQYIDSIETPKLSWTRLVMTPNPPYALNSNMYSGSVRKQLEEIKQCRGCTIASFLHVLRCNSLWPSEIVGSQLLGRLIQHLDEFDCRLQTSPGEEGNVFVKLKDGVSGLCDQCSTALLAILSEYSRLAVTSFNGLCLDCVRHRDRDSLKAYACRYKHKPHEKYLGIYDEASYSACSKPTALDG